MNRVRVLIVDHHAVHVQGRTLYHALAATGRFDVRVIAPVSWSESGVAARFLPDEPVQEHVSDTSIRSSATTVPSRTFFTGKTHRALYVRLWREVREFQPQVLLVNSEPEGFLAWQAAIVCGLSRKNPALVVTTWRNMRYGEGNEPYPIRWTWLCRRIEGFVLKRAAHMIALSPSAPGIFIPRGFSRISYIPPWVDQRRFEGDPARADRRLAIGFVGRLEREKGVDLLLQSLASVTWPFVIEITGDGSERIPLEHRARELGLNDRCTFRRAVPPEQIPSVLHRLDVLVLPSRSRPGWKEQFGRVLIEAMAAGVVVVGSDSGDIPAVIADAGCLFREDDVDDLRGKLEALAGDPALRERLRTAGRLRIASEYSLDRAVERYADLLSQLSPERS